LWTFAIAPGENLGEKLSQHIHPQLRERISAAKEDRDRIFGLASHPVLRKDGLRRTFAGIALVVPKPKLL
jgi:hypothetical protein